MIEAEYVAPSNLGELFKSIEGRAERVKFVAGCTNVLPDLRAQNPAPMLLVDLTGIEDLRRIEENNGVISIGSLATMTELAASEIIRTHGPILASAARALGNPLTRNRATIGGNIADASPAADTAPPLLALEATIQTEGASHAKREIPVEEFFIGPNQTVLNQGELITRITFPIPKDPSASSHIKFGLRNAMAISVVSVAVVLEMQGNLCHRARIALGSVAPKPIRAYLTEKELEGRKITEEVLESCAEVVKKEISPITDIRASAQYREHATGVLLKRALWQAAREGENSTNGNI
ncbi:MAG: xanthine dehydrogenase family protein subunit M [Deltaproteobacteria bacterium]|nr:xanthine dehydrogenase family protein subunit M [Deltaproteobacteria bacterium]MBW1921141.1 xanthine dehydrogenase family protein subunit M [Deltaproteobacteria bacterium]